MPKGLRNGPHKQTITSQSYDKTPLTVTVDRYTKHNRLLIVFIILTAL